MKSFAEEPPRQRREAVKGDDPSIHVDDGVQGALDFRRRASARLYRCCGVGVLCGKGAKSCERCVERNVHMVHVQRRASAERSKLRL